MGCHCEGCGVLLPLANLWLCNACIEKEERKSERRYEEAQNDFDGQVYR